MVASKCKSSDACNPDMPKRSHKVLPLIKKVKVPHVIMKENKPYAKIYRKNKSPIHDTVKKEKEICARFAVLRRKLKGMATVHDKCLVKMGKILYLWAENMNR